MLRSLMAPIEESLVDTVSTLVDALVHLWNAEITWTIDIFTSRHPLSGLRAQVEAY